MRIRDDDRLHEDMARRDEEDEEKAMLVMSMLSNSRGGADQPSSEKGGALLVLFIVGVVYVLWNWVADIASPKIVDAAPVLVGTAAEAAVSDAWIDGTGGQSALPAKNGKRGKRPERLVVARAENKDYQALPLTGQYRFAMPKDVVLDALAVGPRGGYIDRFENEWVPVKGKTGVVRWLEYLSERGSLRMAWATAGRGHLLVGRDGKAG